MVQAMADTKSGPLSPKKPVKEKIVGIYDVFFKVTTCERDNIINFIHPVSTCDILLIVPSVNNCL